MRSVFLENSRHAFLQTDGTMAWPNSLEGDLLKRAYQEIEKLHFLSKLSTGDNRGTEINVNDTVLVQLTDHGRRVHRQSFEDVFGANHPYRPPQEDADGWSRWQLWSLMEHFGSEMGLACCLLPFSTNIRIE